MSKFVTKCNGRKELFDIKKIHESIDKMVSGLDVDRKLLESKLDDIIHDEISTDKIQESLVEYSKQFCTSADTIDWAFVAGRGETMRRWKKTHVFEKTFFYYLKEQIERGVYKHKGLNCWTKREIISLGKQIEHNRDLNHSYGSVITANKKYLLENETIQHMFMVNSMIIASVEEKSKRLTFAKKVYHALSKRKLSLATPWLSNLRRDKNISSCFIIRPADDLTSIAKNWNDAAQISKLGGGIGVDLSLIRASGSEIAGRKNSSKGVVPWCKVLNDIAVAVDQGGSRAGAITINVPIWHRDIEDFLEIQSENKDPRRQCFDIFPQISYYDIFMKEQKKDDGGTWHTFCPHEVETVLNIKLSGIYGKKFESAYKRCVKAYEAGKLENVGVYHARSLVKIAMRSQVESGLPYLFNYDLANKLNPNNHDGSIPCANLCTESFSNVVEDEYSHTCNLLSIVGGRVDSFEELAELAQLATRILDNGILLTNPPTPESKAHNERYKTIGVGIQGMHDWLIKNDYNYSDYDKISEFCEHIEFNCIKESIELSKERGCYPAFPGSQWDTGEMTKRFKKHSVANLDWDGLQKLINEHGVANSQFTSPAPNTSTAPFMDGAAGFMPVYRAFFLEDNSTGRFPVFGMYLKDKPLAYEYSLPRMHQPDVTKAVQAAQRFIDTGISAEYVFDMNHPDFTVKWLWDLWNASHENETKAVYYIRWIPKGQTIDDVMGGESICAGCTG